MRLFIAAFILVLTFQAFVKADNINEFEIEGIGVGYSAFDFYSKNEIDKSKAYVYKSKKYAMFGKDVINSNYEHVLIEFIDTGNYLINSVIGKIFYNNNNFDQCSIKENEILIELKKQFKESAEYTNHGITSHEADPSGKSKGSWHTFKLNDGSGWIYLECMNWAEETGKWDNLRVTIFNKTFQDFLVNEAY